MNTNDIKKSKYINCSNNIVLNAFFIQSFVKKFKFITTKNPQRKGMLY